MTECPNEHPRRRYVKVAEAASYADCGEWAIRKMLAHGQLTKYRIGPSAGAVRVDLNELDEAMHPEKG